MHYCNHKFTYDILIVHFMILIIELKKQMVNRSSDATYTSK